MAGILRGGANYTIRYTNAGRYGSVRASTLGARILTYTEFWTTMNVDEPTLPHLKSGGRKVVWVRVPPPLLIKVLQIAGKSIARKSLCFGQARPLTTV
jgi:hypothetical protein